MKTYLQPYQIVAPFYNSHTPFALTGMFRYLAAMSTNHRIVFNTCPDQDSARKIANALVEQGLAACINIVPGLESIYKWGGQIEHGTECLLIIKTDINHYAELEQAIVKQHPYELPEIIVVPISEGLPAYLRWMDECLKQ